MASWMSAGDAFDTKGDHGPPDRDLWRALLGAIEEERPAWHVSAACRDADPGWFFPPRGDPNDDGLKARAVCRECPVRLLCELDVMAMPSTTPGVWADTSIVDRKAMRKAHRQGAA